MDIKIDAVKLEPFWWQTQGLYYNLNRNKIPQQEMIRINGDSVWRRVYGAEFGNSGMLFIIVNGEKIILDFKAEETLEHLIKQQQTGE